MVALLAFHGAKGSEIYHRGWTGTKDDLRRLLAKETDLKAGCSGGVTPLHIEVQIGNFL
jgi:hypothetical protein